MATPSSEIRQAIAEALTEIGLGDEPEHASKLANPDEDITFAELDVDSLSAAEASVLIEDKTGVPCDIGDFILHGSVNALAIHLGERRDEQPGN